MPRHSRQQSGSGIYHVIMRGINRQTIFEDEEDNNRLIETLKKYKDISSYRLFAYCLMGNHFHLLLKTEGEDLAQIMKRVAGSYVYWYNLKYERSGHLFQDRFKSESVESDRYFLAVLRYIHQNPINAGLCSKAEEYDYSSYNDYISGRSKLLDIEYVFSIIDRDSFIEMSNEKTDDRCLESEDRNIRINDHDAMAIIQSVSNCASATAFQSIEIACRDVYLKELKTHGLSIRQISRLTGISFSIVRRA